MADTINCDPAALAKAAACYCFDENQGSQVEIYLLAQIAGTSLTPAQLGKAAACYCFDALQAEKVKAYLLCQIVNALS